MIGSIYRFLRKASPTFPLYSPNSSRIVKSAMSNFTLDQKKAHDTTRHIAVTANAGSGKTRVLVSRYCDIIQFGVRQPEEIAAITFTEKAASELRTKIAREFEARLNDPEHRRHWERLKNAREKFTSAVVTTIHGFCSQMLREYPIEAGVSPSYQILSGYERRKAQEDALMETIEETLREPGPADNPFSPAYLTARRISREKMEETVRSMMYNREAIDYSERHGVLRLTRDETLEMWRRGVDDAVRAILMSGPVRAAMRTLIDRLKEKHAADAVSTYASIPRNGSAAEIVGVMEELRKILLTKEGTAKIASYDLPKEQLEVLAPHVAVVADAFEQAKPFMEIGDDPQLNGILYNDARVLLHVYHRANLRYTERKERMNALDFEDLQLKLLRALEAPEARARIAGRFRYMMIDEFQDTNEVQYAIAYSLLEQLSAGNLCIVGDRKQSIYGFRNAEVRVFNTASQEIISYNREHDKDEYPLIFRGEELIPDSKEEALGVIKLDASFRLLPSICSYVNEACGPLMDSVGGETFGISYEPLVCARQSHGHGKVEVLLEMPEPPHPSPLPEGEGIRMEEIGGQGELRGESPDMAAKDDSLIGNQKSEIETAESSREANPLDRCDPIWCPEAEMIARRLLGLVRTGDPVIWEMQADGLEHARAARFSDMAILCRKRSFFPAIEQALRKYGVPFITYGGAGFYKTQEIYDLVNYLRTLLNARDDMALLGLLRSPYFCVSDAELYRLSIAANANATGIWERARLHVASGTAEDALVRAVGLITDDRAMAGRVPVSLLIRRLLERTGWRGAVIGSERGEQNLANVDKLLEIAREFDERGFTNLFDFVERVTEMIELEEMESEAPINTGRDAVRLMTMHAAKGLEFPVVVLPSLHSKTPAGSRVYFDKDLGYGWNWTFNGEEFRPPVVALMRLRESQRERAEEARLFYVAITRARDLLILSGQYDAEHPPKDNMLAWVLAPFDEIPAANASVRLASDELRFLNTDGATERSERWEQAVDFHINIEDLPRYEPFLKNPTPFRTELVRIGELQARAEGEIYSASQFLVYSQCPTKYYLKYRLGIPEELSAAWDIDPNARDTDDGTLFARLFRRVAARIDETPHPSPLASPSAARFPEGEGIRNVDVRGIIEDDSENESSMEGTESSIQHRTSKFRNPRITADATLQALESDPVTIADIIDEVLLLEPLTEDERGAMLPRLIETFERMFASSEARAVLFPSGTTSTTEQELRMPFDKDFIMGVMDRMTTAEDGTVSVVHYKTRRLGNEDLARAAEAYLPQLRLYAFLASGLNPKQRSIRTTILFTERPEEPQHITFTRFDMGRIEEELRAAITDIRQITYTGRRELPLRTSHCPLCPYFIEGRCMLDVGG
jgi:ATP-dependent helicase/nuclease subunit A